MGIYNTPRFANRSVGFLILGAQSLPTEKTRGGLERITSTDTARKALASTRATGTMVELGSSGRTCSAPRAGSG